MHSPQEPDPRFTLANERTYLAWMRTALALIAGGIALAHLGDGIGPGWLRLILSAVIILAGSVFAGLAFVHWRSCERALRDGEPLPPPSFAIGLTALIVVAGLILTVALLLEGS